MAARRPPALRAVISLCSTDDRYADDIHLMGGCLLNDNLGWASTMFAYSSRPPDPALLPEEAWRERWLERLEATPLLVANWLRHQHRDAFWRHGSVREDWAAIQCPVYAVGGWADGYSNAVPRLLANLKAPCKGLISPWAHRYPHFPMPGPRIGFLQEALRWWDQWLKGVDTGVMAESAYRCGCRKGHARARTRVSNRVTGSPSPAGRPRTSGRCTSTWRGDGCWREMRPQAAKRPSARRSSTGSPVATGARSASTPS